MNKIKSVYIIGAGGSGRKVLEIIKDINEVNKEYNILGFIDDDRNLWGSEINGFKVLGGLKYLVNQSKKQICYAVNSIADCATKKDIVNKLENHVKWCNIIHPSAIIWSYSEIGIGSIVAPFVTIGPNSIIEDHVFINTNTNIGHDSKIGQFSSIMCLCDITGNVRIGEGVYIASKVSVIPKLNVGNYAKLGAGAIIIKDVKPGITMHGHMAVEAK